MSREAGPNLGNLRDFHLDRESNPGERGPDSSLREWSESTLPLTEPASRVKTSGWTGIDLAQPVAPRLKPVLRPQEETQLLLPKQGIVSSVSDKAPWAVQLALEERRMDREGSVDYHNSFRKHELLKLKTAEFMSGLQNQMRESAEIFNSSRQSAAHHVHVYKVSRTEHDFMLYRNSVKLVVSGQQAGKIFFAFNQYLGDLFAPGRKPVFEIQAAWGALDQLYWSYKGERLDSDDVVRFFFSEFVQQSYR